MVGLFNICDVIGRYLGGCLMIDIKSTFLLHFFAFSRILIIALAIAVQLDMLQDYVFVQNFFIIFDPMILAITNGYVQTIFACYSAMIVS